MYFDMKASGKRIKELRRQQGLTQEMLSEMCGVSEGYIGRLENGQYGDSIDLLIELSELFGTSLDYLILGKNQPYDQLKKKLRIVIDLLILMEKEL